MNIVLCDDMPDQVEKYSQMINSCAQRHGIPVSLRSYTSGDSLLFHAEDRNCNIDLIYLDIHMQGTDGMRVAEKLRGMGYSGDIVFLTLDRERVFQAFDVEAMYYLVKPQTDEATFERIFVWASERARKRRQEYFSISCAGTTVSMPVDDLLFFSYKNRVITAHYQKNGETMEFEFYSSLEKIENSLSAEYFAKANQNCLVSIRKIESITADEIILTTGDRIKLSRRGVNAIRQLYQEYHGPG